LGRANYHDGNPFAEVSLEDGQHDYNHQTNYPLCAMSDVQLRLLSRSDLADVEITPAQVIEAVRLAYIAFAQGESANPAKLSIPLQDRDSVSYSMLGFDGLRQVVGFKTSYKKEKSGNKQYYTTITLYDDECGLPFALMDCARIGALRTPAATALLVDAAALPDSRTALLIGTGTQARQTFPYLLDVRPDLDRLLLYGTYRPGIDEVRRVLRRHYPSRETELVPTLDALYQVIPECDVVLAVSGSATQVRVHTSLLKAGAILVDVGCGVDGSALIEADYAIATSASQMAVTGTYLASTDGVLRPVDAELPHILVGAGNGRRTPQDRVFAYNSGMVVTDIAVGHALAKRAIKQGRGTEIALWS
jgi:ornithine cyclodeaminase/alanine dehydrogenase-like protein (mu-crystallin family)